MNWATVTSYGTKNLCLSKSIKFEFGAFWTTTGIRSGYLDKICLDSFLLWSMRVRQNNGWKRGKEIVSVREGWNDSIYISLSIRLIHKKSKNFDTIEIFKTESVDEWVSKGKIRQWFEMKSEGIEEGCNSPSQMNCFSVAWLHLKEIEERV